MDNITTKMDNFTYQYNIDRKAASKLLKISVRTVDRYIKKKVLTTQNIGGRVWLNKDEIRGIAGIKMTPTIDTEVDMSTPITSIDTVHDIHDETGQYLSTSQTRKIVKEADVSDLYKNLYEKTKEELNEKQERLEIANYRVGQLDAQLKNSIPLLEYHRDLAARKLEKAHLIEKVEYAEKSINSLLKKLKFEQYNRKIVFTILLILLALQPLWLLFLAGGK